MAKLLVDAGRFCAGYHDANVKGVKAKRVQVDEIWSFTAAKEKNVAPAKTLRWRGRHLDLDRDRGESKLIISHFVGGRDGECATWFMNDVAERVATASNSRPTATRPILEAVEGAFGAEIDTPC